MQSGSNLSNYKYVLIIPGDLANVLKSLCEVKNGIFTWGVKEKSQLGTIENLFNNGGVNQTLAVVYASEIGFVALGVLDKVLSDTQIQPFWCDEKDKVIYRYRFTLKLLYISEALTNPIIKNEICSNQCQKEKLKQILEGVKNRVVQYRDLYQHLRMKVNVGYLNSIKEVNKAKAIVEFFEDKIRKGVFVPVLSFCQFSTRLFSKLEPGEFLVLLHALCGKNILLAGPPGSGKTSFLVRLLDKLNISYRIETGNPEWTHYDTVGGPTLQGGVKKGFLFEEAEESNNSLKQGRLHWLIIDEINRANIDLALGKFFTLLDPVYRLKEPLRIGNDVKVHVPFSFRVLATMNSFDRAMLIKLGYALIRRFSVIDHSYIIKLQESTEIYKNKENKLRELKKLDEPGCKESLRIDYDALRNELTLCREDLTCDCITPVDFKETLSKLRDNWDREVFSIWINGIGELRLDHVITCLAKELNMELEKFGDCDVCPIQLTPGILADALKYVALGSYVYNKSGYELKVKQKIGPDVYALLLLDTAISSYIVPQLDVLADYVRYEKYKPERDKGPSLIGILNDISNKLKNYGLIYSAELVEKIGKGYHVF